jgi:hypothetical protein
MIWTATFLQSMVGLILLLAGVSKFADRDALTRVIRNYRLLPDGAARAIARVLPEIEVTLALALLGDVGRRWAGPAAAMLFTLFALAIAINLSKGRRTISCGCFGPDAHSPIGEIHVVRNIGLAFAAVVGTLTGEASLRPDSLDGVSALLAAAIGLVCWWIGSTTLKTWRRVAVNTQSMQ